MSNAETPAENTGGNPATPSTNNPLAELPPRIRVHALARLLGSTSKELLATLSELGEPTRSAQSSVSREVALRVAGTMGAGGAEQQIEGTTEEQAGALPTPQPAVPAAAPQSAAATFPQAPVFAPPSPVFLPPEPVPATKAAGQDAAEAADSAGAAATQEAADADQDEGGEEAGGRRRRRRGRRGRGRGKGGDEASDKDSPDEETDYSGEAGAAKADGRPGAKDDSTDTEDKQDESAEADAESDEGADSASRRRRRRRRRKGGEPDSASSADDPPNTVVHVRESNQAEAARDQVRSVRGSTRLEAKRQRRRDGREAGRRRAPILSEAEFLARRESVERTMVVKESGGKGSKDRTTQIAVLEDSVLVEHFVTSSGSGSIVGNVYLGRVQNVLPSMEAAFVDIGRGRNAVLYAGEVDWDAAGLEGKSRKIEQALSTGDSVLVQVTKDPVGHKGARLTTQISLPGRFLVYVPGGGATGISRKLPENERRRLKDILKRIVPEDAGVIIRTASEGISEDELERDVRRLQAQWEIINEKSGSGSAAKSKKGAPTLLYEEPDLLVKVIRDLFTEDFTKLVVQGSVPWETIDAYVQHVASDLADRLERYVGNGDVFADYRIDEQITKALDRKVWLPSGGYLVIDRTEAMTVIDVNTGKFTGSGGNLEETVTRNNLESAEEIVRQLRLRDIGGIIVIDFIDMVLESNRDLVLRRLTECLGRDRTRHQVAEVTSLGLVQMTRKRVGTGLLEAFSASCEHCKGRGVVVSTEPHQGVNGGPAVSDGQQGRKRGKGKSDDGRESVPVVPEHTPEQRESIVSAVQAMANASKAAAGKGSAGMDSEPAPVDSQPPAVTPEPATNGHIKHAEPQPDSAPAEAGEAAQAPERPQTSAAEVAEAAEPVEPVEPQIPQPASRTVRRRPRRAATRPAGPPVGAAASAASDSEVVE
ncbi:MAG: translation initiation factor IF-2 N-terminal domain-containing protein [Haloechinothrix sp.]